MKDEILEFNPQYLDLEKMFKDKIEPKVIDQAIRNKYYSENNGIKIIQKTMKKTEKIMKKRISAN